MLRYHGGRGPRWLTIETEPRKYLIDFAYFRSPIEERIFIGLEISFLMLRYIFYDQRLGELEKF